MPKITLETGKTVEILGVNVHEWGEIKVIVKFVELEIERKYPFGVEELKNWLKANPGKTWKDFGRERLLPLYNKLKDAVEVKELIK